MAAKNIICFDTSKNERFQLTTTYRILQKKLKLDWIIEQNNVELKEDFLKRINVLVLAGPQEHFTEEEFQALKEFVSNGGKLLVALGKGGERDYHTNINFFLEQYGIFINNDSVIRPHYYNKFRPEECTIIGGVFNDALLNFLGSKVLQKIEFDFTDETNKLEFQYPYGATLNVKVPAHILLTSGHFAYPFNRPLASVCCDINENAGKILVIGSGYIWHDKFLQTNKTNEAILDYCLQLLKSETTFPMANEFSEVEISENKTLTSLKFLANTPRACLIDSIGSDKTVENTNIIEKFDMKLCMLSNRLVTEVTAAYEQLKVKYEPLKIIKPNFEIPLPPLQLTTFLPIFCEPANAQLELFDFDDVFSPPEVQLSQTTGKYIQILQKKTVTEQDIKAYIKECGRITGIINELSAQDINPETILYTAMKKILNCNF